MKYYGCLQNRMLENKQFGEIYEGMGATQYLYSDCHAYEVVKVIDQTHVFIRRVKAIRVDKNGMSDAQDYRFESDPTSPKIELTKRNGAWYQVHSIEKSIWEKNAKQWVEDGSFNTFESAYNYFKFMSHLTQSQIERVEAGKIVKKFNKFDGITFGRQEEFFDYTF